MWIKTNDGSIEDASGKVMFFSCERFVNDICLGDCCFICGARRGSKKFNDEHVLPDWILRRYDLYGRTITLPNDRSFRYDRYKIPCCEECNTRMARVIEEPISKLVGKGSDAVNDYLVAGHLLEIVTWMALIYLKTHLKDREMRVHLDTRDGGQKIADEYDWAHLHHVHCLARSFYTGCFVEREVFGSFFGLAVNGQGTNDRFDFGDLYVAQSLMIRLGDVGLVTVFNDSGAAMQFFSPRAQKITGAVSHLQLREVAVELAWLNVNLKERPNFYTETNRFEETVRMRATLPSKPPELQLPLDFQQRGELLAYSLRPIADRLKLVGRSQEEAMAAIKAGTLSFLFNDNDEFIQQSFISETTAES